MRRAALTLLTVLVLAIAASAAWLAFAIFGDRSHPASTTGVVVPQGSSFSDIARQLQSAGIIGNAATFWLYAGLNLVFLVITFWLIPETKNVTLEQIERNLMAGKPLREIGQ